METIVEKPAAVAEPKTNLEAPASLARDLVTESIVNVEQIQTGDNLSWRIFALDVDGREKGFPCSLSVCQTVSDHSYTHNKNRSYKLVFDKLGIVTSVIPGELRVPRGLKLAVQAHNSEPANSVVLRRDRLSEGKFSDLVVVKAPMGLGQERVAAFASDLAKAKVGDKVAHGYILFRRIEQAPGVEFLVLTR